MKTPTNHVFVTCLWILIGCWASLTIGPLWFLVVPGIVLGVSIAIHQKSWIALLLLTTLNPLFVSFAIGVASYFGGTPTLAFVGLPELESFNIDRSSRCFRSGGGCVVDGGEWLTLVPHNATLRLMSSVFGPPTKSYDGPYPTKEEADRVSSDAPITPINQFLQGEVRVDDQTISLGNEIVTRLVHRLRFYDIADRQDADDVYVVKAALYQNRCLVLRISEDREPKINGTNTVGLILIDTKNKRPFAYFTLLGYFRTRTPPLHYLASWDR